MVRIAKYAVGQVVRHRIRSFRGIVFDVDPEFDDTNQLYESTPEQIRYTKDQPFYYLHVENNEAECVAYVSEQNLLADDSGIPVTHPQAGKIFSMNSEGRYIFQQSTHH